MLQGASGAAERHGKFKKKITAWGSGTDDTDRDTYETVNLVIHTNLTHYS